MSNKSQKIKAISMKNLGYSAKEIRKLVEDKKGSVFLGRISGVVANYFSGESKNGEFTGFRGAFAAVNAAGEVYESGTAFFPAGVANDLKKQLEQGVIEIEVTADVYAEESDKNASGYAYICEPVLSAEKQDRMSKMKANLTKGLPTMLEDKTKDKTEAKKEKAAA